VLWQVDPDASSGDWKSAEVDSRADEPDSERLRCGRASSLHPIFSCQSFRSTTSCKHCMVSSCLFPQEEQRTFPAKTCWYPTSFPQFRIIVRPPNRYLPLSLTLKGREAGEGARAPPRPSRLNRDDLACPHVLPTDRQTPPAGRVVPILRWNARAIKSSKTIGEGVSRRHTSARASPPRRSVCEKQLTPTKRGRRSPPSAQRRQTSVFLRVAPATSALDGEREGCFSTPRPTSPTVINYQRVSSICPHVHESRTRVNT